MAAMSATPFEWFAPLDGTEEPTPIAESFPYSDEDDVSIPAADGMINSNDWALNYIDLAAIPSAHLSQSLSCSINEDNADAVNKLFPSLTIHESIQQSFPTPPDSPNREDQHEVLYKPKAQHGQQRTVSFNSVPMEEFFPISSMGFTPVRNEPQVTFVPQDAVVHGHVSPVQGYISPVQQQLSASPIDDVITHFSPTSSIDEHPAYSPITVSGSIGSDDLNDPTYVPSPGPSSSGGGGRPKMNVGGARRRGRKPNKETAHLSKEERKKLSNRTAAQRYRLRQNMVYNQIDAEEEDLRKKNDELKGQLGKLQQEATLLKGLFRDLLRKRGISVPM